MEILKPPSDWYKQIWTLDIKNQLWTEKTDEQVDFIIKALHLTGKEKILDLACGYGRHSLELARRGYQVVGVDITEEYVNDANIMTSKESLNAEFHHADVRSLLDSSEFHNNFDVVLNLADGAIGYLEDETENLKIFKVISICLKRGGKSLIDIVNKEHAQMHFPKRSWKIGSNSISLPSFEFEEDTNRMIYGGFSIKFGEIAKFPDNFIARGYTRLYSFEEITRIFDKLQIDPISSYGDYNLNLKANHKNIQLLIFSKKR